MLDACLDTSAAARYCGVSKALLEKLRCVGGGAKFLKISRRVVYRRSDLDAWLDTHERRSTSDAGGDHAG